MLRPPGGLQGSAAGLRCQEEGAGLAESSVYRDQGLSGGSCKTRVGMPLASNGRCQAFLSLQWFQCVCMGVQEKPRSSGVDGHDYKSWERF